MDAKTIMTWQHRVKINGTWEGDAMKLEIDDLRAALQSQAERINELERESETHAVIAMLQAYGAACAAHAREMALSDSELLDFVEAHPHLTLRNHKKRWSFVGLTNYEYTTFDTARAAIKATLEASEY